MHFLKKYKVLYLSPKIFSPNTNRRYHDQQVRKMYQSQISELIPEHFKPKPL